MTGPAVGENTVFGVAAESVYGGDAAIDRFYKILPGETLERKPIIHKSAALIGGARNGLPATRERIVGEAASGDVKLEVPTTKAGLLFKHLLGGASITGAGPVKTHVYSTGDVSGLSMAAEKQIYDAAGVDLIGAFHYRGGKILKGGFSISPEGVLELTLGYDFQREALLAPDAEAAASYATDVPFLFSEGVLKVDGSTVANVRTVTVDLENPADVNRRFLGGGLYKSEPADTDRPTAGGTFGAEFLDTDLYELFEARTAVELDLMFTSADDVTLTRDFTDGVTATSTSLISATAAFTAADVGITVSGDDIFAGTTIASVTNGTTVVLSHVTTGTGSGRHFHLARPVVPFSLDINLPAIVLPGKTPAVGGPGIISVDIPWEGRSNVAADPMVSLTYVTTDTVS